MNKRFFIHNVTIYHKQGETFAPTKFNNVYFRINRVITPIDGGYQKNGNGTIYIPLDSDIDINVGDYVIGGSITEPFDYALFAKKYEIYKVLSVRDCRKGNLKHWQVEVSQ